MYDKYLSIDDSIPILSPPVLMHSGLLGVAFCPSVCLSVWDWTKIPESSMANPTVSNPTKNSLRTNSVGLTTSDCMLIKVYDTGRWAHFNVKLYFYDIGYMQFDYNYLLSVIFDSVAGI